MPTIDDTVNPAAPPGYALAANVIVVPRYLAGVFLPDGSAHIKAMAPQTMAPAVSFDFPKPEVHTQNAVPYILR